MQIWVVLYPPYVTFRYVGQDMPIFNKDMFFFYVGISTNTAPPPPNEITCS